MLIFLTILHSRILLKCKKIEILSYLEGGFRQEWIKVGWKAYGSYVKLIKNDPFNYVFWLYTG